PLYHSHLHAFPTRRSSDLMLGNFSFGDYFKEEAIHFAWEYLTRVVHLSPERLWVTVYKEDDEAYAVWEKKVKIPAARLVKCGERSEEHTSELQSPDHLVCR